MGATGRLIRSILNEIMTANTRRNDYGRTRCRANQSIPVATALRAHTLARPGSSAFPARSVGHRGQDADLIVINRNPLKVRPGSIDKTRVLRRSSGAGPFGTRRAPVHPSDLQGRQFSTGEAGHDHGH